MARLLDLIDERIFAKPAAVGRRRTMRQWSEEEIVLPPGGPRAGERFRIDSQPFTGLLLDEIDSGRWNVIAITGPSQSSKTLCGNVIPTVHAVAELEENIVYGVPEGDMADDKWKTDIVPILEASPRLRHLLPTKGSGSKGGKVSDRIDLPNGVRIKIMTSGSSDQGKAGFTARLIRITEAAGFSVGASTSSESDPLRQFKARQRSFQRELRQLIVEGTVTIPTDLPWRLRGTEASVISSLSQLVTPCPYCGAAISPEREHFKGWEQARTEVEAMELAAFYCPACDHPLTEEDRIKANQSIRIVHYGQTINHHFEVVGELPPTSTLWFRWSQWHNLLLPSAEHAAEEWEKAQMKEGSRERESKEKELCQFVWNIPYDPPMVQFFPLTDDDVAGAVLETCRRAEVPEGITAMTAAADVRGTQLHYTVLGFKANGSAHAVDFGVIPIDRHKYGDRRGILVALRFWKTEVIRRGYLGRDRRRYHPMTIWVDAGWKTEVIRRFVKECQAEGDSRWYLSFGRGQSQPRGEGSYLHPSKISADKPFIGDQFYVSRNRKYAMYYVFMNADVWKTNVHEAFSVPPDEPGALSLWDPVTEDERRLQRTYAQHIVAEKASELIVPGRGPVIVWDNSTGRHNHFLDTTYMALAGGYYVGVRVLEDSVDASATSPPAALPDQSRAAPVARVPTRPDGTAYFASDRS